MRALLKWGADNTLIVTKVGNMLYDPDEKVLCLYPSADDLEPVYCVGPMDQDKADWYVSKLFHDGQVDLTEYPIEVETDD